MLHKIRIFCGIFLLMSGVTSLALGADRNVAVDQTVGGMEQGRRIQSPGSYSNKGVTSGSQGSTTGSITDRHTVLQESEKTTTADPQSKNVPGDADRLPSGGNRGILYQAGREQTDGSSTTTTPAESSARLPDGQGQAGPPSSEAGQEQDSGSANAGGDQTGQTGQTTEQVNNPVDTGGTNTGTGETNTGSDGSETNPPAGEAGPPEDEADQADTESGSNNPIIGVDAEVNPGSGTVDADVETDTSGELEDRQIIDAGATTGETSTQTETGSATEVTGSETVHETDVTTQPITEATGQTGDTTTSIETGNGGVLVGGETSPTGQIGTEESSTDNSPTTTEESSSNPIVDVDAEVNPGSGTVDADVETDTSGELEDRQIIDAGATTGETSTQTETGSATEITGSETVHETDVTTQPVTDTTGQTGDTTTSVATEGNGGILVEGETSPTGQIETGEMSTGTESPETSAEESSSDSSNPIIGVDAEVSPESGTVEADTTIDTSGELEERQILDADLTGETTGSVGAEAGSAVDITAADLVEESDITTELVTETIGQLDAGQTSGSGGVQESSDTASDPIVGLDTNINPESGTVDTNVDLELSGEIEDTRILELDLVAEDTTSIETDLGSASGITESETVGSLDVTTETTESLIPAPADLVAEIDTTGQTVGGEVDTGITADVEGMSEGEDVASDPADGLSVGVSGL